MKVRLPITDISTEEKKALDNHVNEMVFCQPFSVLKDQMLFWVFYITKGQGLDASTYYLNITVKRFAEV